MIWLFIGSSPTAASGMAAARRDWEIDATITTNRGIFLEPVPDVYLLADAVSFVKFDAQAKQALADGSKIVAVGDYIEESNVPHSLYSEYLEVEHFISSGVTCIEYAARRAEQVVVVGCDGYVQGEDPYFESSHLNTRWLQGGSRDHQLARMTERQIRPGTQDVCDRYPEVDFIAYGDLHYQIDAPNWHTMEI